MIQFIKDLWLEVRIQAALNNLLNEKSRDRQREIAARMAGLCKQRSPRQIARMERAKGLQ